MEKRYIVAESRLVVINIIKKELQIILTESAAHCASVGLSGRHDAAGLAAIETLKILKEQDLLFIPREELLDLEEEAGPHNALLADMYYRLSQV